MDFSSTYSIPGNGGFLIAAIPGIINIIVALYVVFMMPQRKITDLFAALLLFSAAWQLSNSMMRLSVSADTARLWDVALSGCWAMTAPLMIHFTLMYLHYDWFSQRKRIIYPFYVLALILIPLYPFYNTTVDYAFLNYWGWYNPHNNSVYNIFFGIWIQAHFIISIVLFTIALFKAKRNTPKFYQLLLLDAALILVIFQAAITEAIIPQVFNGDPIPITSTTMLLFTLAGFVTLNKFRLFRGDEALKKGNLLSAISDIVIVVNVDGTISYINESGLKKLGYERDELTGTHMSAVFRSEKENFSALNSKLGELVFSGKNIRNFKGNLNSKTGKILPTLVSADAVKNGRVTEGVLLVARDVSDIEQANEEIRKHISYMEELFNASPFAIVMNDNAGNVLNVNRGFEEIFQYKLSDIAGKPLNDFIVPSYLIEEGELISSTCLKKKSVTTETKRLKKNGELIDVALIGYPIVIDGALSGIYGLYLDISERKQYEETLIEKNEELTKINKELDRFIYSVSHDIRSPLMSILGLLNLAEGQLQHPELKTYCNMIRGRIVKLDDFTQEIIKYSRNARTELTPEEIDFKSVIDEIVENLRYYDKAANLSFEVLVNQDSRFIGDKSRLSVVLTNLISNAIKYQKAELGGYVKIAATVKNDKAEIHIEDNGEGIAQEKTGDIFEMFTRFSDKSTGSGLGLYIVKEVIEKLNGNIGLESELGQGTRFKVVLDSLRDD